MSGEKKPFERLPTNVVPHNYNLELTPDLKAFTFKGKLEITAEVCVSQHARKGVEVLCKGYFACTRSLRCWKQNMVIGALGKAILLNLWSVQVNY